MAAMPILPFLVLTTLGSALWVIALAYLGVLLGENYAIVGQYIDPVSKFVLAAMVFGTVGWVIYRLVRQRRVAVQS